MKFLLNMKLIIDEKDLGPVMVFIHQRTKVADLNISPATEEPLLITPHPSRKDKPMTCRQMILRELAKGPTKSGALSKVGVANGFGASTAYTTLATMLKEVTRKYNGTYSLTTDK